MAESVDNSSSEGCESSDYDEISPSELSTSCESMSVKVGLTSLHNFYGS